MKIFDDENWSSEKKDKYSTGNETGIGKWFAAFMYLLNGEKVYQRTWK